MAALAIHMKLPSVTTAFFLSGFAALLYQVAWQRTLFVAFGVDIESVTVVVSIFMLGLGAGGIFGGYLADRFPNRILQLFCLAEFCIALIGMVSIDAITVVGIWASGVPTFFVAVITFAMVLPPTLLMGATLPMLVAHSARVSGSVGASTGGLYFVNTLGAALGAFTTGFFLLYWLDLRQATWVASTANVMSALSIAISLLRERNV
jgi:predicted membrane-bound spermidine synthase